MKEQIFHGTSDKDIPRILITSFYRTSSTEIYTRIYKFPYTYNIFVLFLRNKVCSKVAEEIPLKMTKIYFPQLDLQVNGRL